MRSSRRAPRIGRIPLGRALFAVLVAGSLFATTGARSQKLNFGVKSGGFFEIERLRYVLEVGAGTCS